MTKTKDGLAALLHSLAIIFVVACAIVITGCAGTFGHNAMTVTHAPDGKGCDLTMNDGKEFLGRDLLFDGKTCSLVVQEGGSKAFKGQAIGAKVMTIMPVTGLDDLLK